MERKALSNIAEEHGTPCYVYDLNALEQNVKSCFEASKGRNYHVHYAVKANTDARVLAVMKNYGFGVDCVSGFEVAHALKHGFSPDHVVFAGVGKSDEEIIEALHAEIFCFNCESLAEVEVINELAKKEGKVARIALRLNPNVDAKTHKYITTGLNENKFGISSNELAEAIDVIAEFPAIDWVGIHFHIGSQITDLSVFRNLCTRVNELLEYLESRKVFLDHVNVGGGLGINYENPIEDAIPDYAAFFKIFDDFLQLRDGQTLHFELGRSLVGNMGYLLSKVLYIKEGEQTKFAILDSGMTELIRPALYQALHHIENISKWFRDDLPVEKYDVVGPICESSDVFRKALLLPKTERGDIMAICSAGAYAEVMASNYNLRPKAKVHYIEG